ncbi:protein phosphatase Slingshot homolog 3-like isoform X1 [Oncorhynchus keta]|uniref:protein phosphatase Slingshot homolog 3-like isoform X1 n=1 Tax=Oncorhynchus keta TaxID=8018 RepID=UPI00227C7C6B|nr:protein phosphatase Slingshot homolog 3-like isoform X1 [Oncorhynchus keta]
MALLTLHRPPSISTAPDESIPRRGRLQKRESFALVKGAVLLLEGEREEPHEETSPNHFPSPLKLGGGASDTQHRHLHAMVSLLRPEDTIKLAVRLESVSPVRVRYLIVVSTLGNKQESILLGMDFPDTDSDQCTIGMVVPIWSATQVYLDGDGSPEMFDRVHVRALAGPLKDIQRLVPKLLLRCLGCVLRVVALLEGDPSPQSEVLSAQG